MSRELPPIDMHAHIDPQIAPRALESLGAVVFAATRSLDEYEQTLSRRDTVTVWGLGCHPGIVASQRAYDEARFAELLTMAPLVSEVGLDGAASTPIEEQAQVFASILAQVARTPRIMSVHTRRATKRALDLIEQSGAQSVILHWWLGSDAETHRAIELGCLFSVNRSMDAARLKEAGVPLHAILPETDHPSGNRGGGEIRQPGWTLDVERATAAVYGTTVRAIRRQFWETLVMLLDDFDLSEMLPPVVQVMTAEARSTFS